MTLSVLPMHLAERIWGERLICRLFSRGFFFFFGGGTFSFHVCLVHPRRNRTKRLTAKNYSVSSCRTGDLRVTHEGILAQFGTGSSRRAGQECTTKELCPKERSVVTFHGLLSHISKIFCYWKVERNQGSEFDGNVNLRAVCLPQTKGRLEALSWPPSVISARSGCIMRQQMLIIPNWTTIGRLCTSTNQQRNIRLPVNIMPQAAAHSGVIVVQHSSPPPPQHKPNVHHGRLPLWRSLKAH